MGRHTSPFQAVATVPVFWQTVTTHQPLGRMGKLQTFFPIFNFEIETFLHWKMPKVKYHTDLIWFLIFLSLTSYPGVLNENLNKQSTEQYRGLTFH